MNPYIKMIKQLILPFIALIAFLFALTMVLGRPSEIAKPLENEPPLSQYEQNIAGIGIIEPKSELISIGTDLSGIVRVVYVKVGSQVKKTDRLFSLDQREIDSQIMVLKANLAAAETQALDANVQFDTVQNVKNPKAVSKDEFNRRKFANQLAQRKVDEVKAQLQQAYTTQERLIVRAPIDGEILEVNVRPGEYAPSGSLSKPLILMGDTSLLHVRTEIDEENAVNVDQNALAKGFARGNTKRGIPLKFVRFEPYVKPKQNLTISGQRVDTRVLQVIYALPPDEKDVYVGQQMDVFIEFKPLSEQSSTTQQKDLP